jgi:hypothetical protein
MISSDLLSALQDLFSVDQIPSQMYEDSELLSISRDQIFYVFDDLPKTNDEPYLEI